MSKKIKKKNQRKLKIKKQKHLDNLKRQKETKKIRKIKLPKLTDASFPDALFRFWLAHGVNYIVSDYDNGVWNPLFPEIYDGIEIDATEMAKRITQKFIGETKNERWPKQGRVALSWSLISKDIAFIYYNEAIKKAKQKDAVSLPANPAVWGIFKFMLDSVDKKKMRTS